MCITFSEQAKNSKSEKNDIWKRGLRGDKQVFFGGGGVAYANYATLNSEVHTY